eukprot:GHVU01230212.1.p1 GENE.GHVU01230212.1~~GHVU01230212.1.p1  ORF type:complete len:152 (-),score=8.80 GHVU01230212.1:755-1210(-)
MCPANAKMHLRKGVVLLIFRNSNSDKLKFLQKLRLLGKSCRPYLRFLHLQELRFALLLLCPSLFLHRTSTSRRFLITAIHALVFSLFTRLETIATSVANRNRYTTSSSGTSRCACRNDDEGQNKRDKKEAVLYICVEFKVALLADCTCGSL